jgi:hypothetical protein
MKIKQISLIFLTLVLSASCKKHRDYHIQGTLMNEVTGNSHNMGGEYIQLVRISPNRSINIFSNPDKTSIVAEAITDNEGHFDFGINQIKEGDYQINYVQGDAKIYYGVSNSFTNITLGKNTNFDEKIAVIPTMGGMNFFANPLNTSSANDTLFVEFVSQTRQAQNPSFMNTGFDNAASINNHLFQAFAGVNNTEFMGNVFIKITKSYNGSRTVTRDTVYVEKDQIYNYNIPF